jgi:RHS repeat-associated protein
LTTYLWGLDLSGSLEGAGGVGGLLAARKKTSITKDVGFFYDGNGNVVQLVDLSDESIEAKYEYDPFGKEIVATGDLADWNKFRFSTKYLEDVVLDSSEGAELGLLYYGYRYYSPRLGRWITRDSLGEAGGLNLLCTVRNNLINYFDIYGLLISSSSRLDDLREKRKYILREIEMYDQMLPVSTALLQYYLSNNGGGYYLDPSWIMSIDATHKAVERNNKEIESQISKTAKSLHKGEETILLDYWQATEVVPFDISDRDAKYALQGFTITSYYKVHLKKLENCVEIFADIQHLAWDYYDFNAGTNITIPGVGKISCDDLIDMKSNNLASSFWVYSWMNQSLAGSYSNSIFHKNLDASYSSLSSGPGDSNAANDVIQENPGSQEMVTPPRPKKRRKGL